MSKMFKVLIDGKSIHGGNLTWDLPRNGKPGKWHCVKDEISICTNGLHLTAKPYEWYKWGADVYEAEGRGKSETTGDKTAFREARLLRLIEDPGWLKQAKKFIDTIKDVKWFCNGKLPKSKKIRMFETRAAAWAAASDAASDAARNAARDAARDAASDAARNAARDAARDAARAAAWAAAWAAASDAASDAAWAAALFVECFIAELKGKHLTHVKLRWSVWHAGYGVYCDVNGVFYCYKRP